MILIVDDDIAVRTSLQLMLEGASFPSVCADGHDAALRQLALHPVQLVILDMNFTPETSGKEGLALLRNIREDYPNIPVILITGWATIQLAVEGMKLGAADFINKPWSNDHLLQSIRTALQLREQQPQPAIRQELDSRYRFGQIIGQDPQLLQVLETIGRIAATDAPVLITGESGTGKELIAEAIHENSGRATKPFVKVNLGGISATLFESEMFGHVRGAFTDARNDRIGRFEMAHKGTIFLDEIGDLDAASQVKLLRVLQDRTYEVLGSSRTKMVDVRVVCATNRNLGEMVAQGLFREDLLYRINLISIKLPALRERTSDIPLLLDFFTGNLKEIYRRPALGIAPAAVKWLSKQPFPGNIRQFKNLVERTILLAPKDLLDVDDFQGHLSATATGTNGRQLPAVGEFTLEEMEVLMIRKAMEFHRNKVSRAAASLGLTRSALYRRLEKYNIPYDETED
ncbi:sigma-54 dependent transcriptional regulator [Chitinophaga sp. sic0106]|uniref:sigma-54-dependent transcriptional regulator n=1 Tax=Chitinophaga sp. sic0106 TaxID=2854785 RepID=UPI001C477252|nr:sigma-54 dependent transcriptional regulator [Chitinophaga sp. sic0106]MBV7529706.1 sigma-54 dependent transcriptional regulator [Chitinophaga sp. sic0106]